MAAIDRTAYPRFKRRPTQQDLATLYTPTPEEVSWVSSTARSESTKLMLGVALKVFQRLGRFPPESEIPPSIVRQVRQALELGSDVDFGYDHPRTRYRQRQLVRAFLGVSAFDRQARHTASPAVANAAAVMDHPADLINVAVEELVRTRCELPAFSTLDRLARRIRTLANQRWFARVLERCPADLLTALDALLEVQVDERFSTFNRLKRLPKKATLRHLQDLVEQLTWLRAQAAPATILDGLSAAKIRRFAAEARALDAAEVRKFAPPKRYTLLLSLLHRSTVQAVDNAATMFCKRLAAIHRRGKDDLAEIRSEQRAKTESLVLLLADLVSASEAQSDAEVGQRVRSLIAPRGTQAVLADCAAISAYNGDNYLPLLAAAYKSHRATLFRLARLLRFVPTSQDASLARAVDWLLENEGRREEQLNSGLDLRFASDRWQRTVVEPAAPGLPHRRRHLEVCIFSCLADELRSGDMAVVGSEAYADYREQLLSDEECAPLIVDYCRDLALPETASGFVQGLREWLTDTARAVDNRFEEGDIAIGASGVPVLRRAKSRAAAASAVALETEVLQRMPERNLLDILANVERWTRLTRHFGPLSGSEPKLDRPVERYVLTTFAYGCNLGPT